jgi:hypothetical protein
MSFKAAFLLPESLIFPLSSLPPVTMNFDIY